MRHMTDDELQAYLDKGTSSLDRIFENHINDCSQCRKAVNQYRSLYEKLAAPDKDALPTGFTDKVATMLTTEFNAMRWRSVWSWVGISTGVIAAILTSIGMFGTFQPVKVALISATEPFVSLVSKIVGITGNRIGNEGSGGEIVLFGLLIMLTVSIADFCLKRFRTKKFCL